MFWAAVVSDKCPIKLVFLVVCSTMHEIFNMACGVYAFHRQLYLVAAIWPGKYVKKIIEFTKDGHIDVPSLHTFFFSHQLDRTRLRVNTENNAERSKAIFFVTIRREKNTAAQMFTYLCLPSHMDFLIAFQ